MNLNHPIIQDCLDNGIPLTIKKKDGVVFVSVPGFYKSGTIKLTENAEGLVASLVAESRYNETEVVHEFDDLVQLNFRWWQRSRERAPGWKVPDAYWLPHLLRLGYVSEQTEKVYTPKVFG